MSIILSATGMIALMGLYGSYRKGSSSWQRILTYCTYTVVCKECFVVVTMKHLIGQLPGLSLGTVEL